MEMFYLFLFLLAMHLCFSIDIIHLWVLFNFCWKGVFVLVDGVTPIIDLCSWKDLASKVIHRYCITHQVMCTTHRPTRIGI